jgi:hypothetical protein
MLKRCQQYMEEKPLQGWLIRVAVLLVFWATLYAVAPGRKNLGLANLYAGSVFGVPTFYLVRRFSDERRHEKPISPRQEFGVGTLSLIAAVCSISAEMALIVARRFGIALSDAVALRLLMLFSMSALLSLALGYAARHSRVGRCGLLISTIWLSLLVIMAFMACVRLARR